MGVWTTFERYVIWICAIIIVIGIAVWLARIIEPWLVNRLDLYILSEKNQIAFAEETIEEVCSKHVCDKCPCFNEEYKKCKYKVLEPWRWSDANRRESKDT